MSRSTRWGTLRPVLMAVILLTSACARLQGSSGAPPADGLTVELTVEERERRVGEAELSLRVVNADGRPVPVARVVVEGNMTHPGMGPVLATAGSRPDGVYAIPFTWTMAGDWVMTVQAELADGREIRHDFHLTIAGIP